MIRKSIFLPVLFLLISFPLIGQDLVTRDTTPGTIPSYLSKDTILIGDQIQWIMPLSLQQGDEFFFEPVENPITAGVERIGDFVVDTLKLKKGKLEIQGKMIITSFDSGTFFLPPVMVAIDRGKGKVDTLFFDGPILEVNTIQIDTTSFKPFDIKGQIKYPVKFAEVLPWAGIILLIAIIVWLIIRFIKTRKENKTFFGKPIVQEPPHIVALRSLDKIRNQKLWQNNKQKQYYTAVTDTLRLYISRRYEISAMEMPSKQMLELLSKQKLTSVQFEEMTDLFTTADLVKFAKYVASEDQNEQAIPMAVRFVNNTFIQELEEDKK